jgi:hypothetical protein
MPTTACASVQMAGRPQIGGTLQGGTLKKAAAVGCRQPCRRQVGLLLRASAASMPSPDSSNGASQPHTNGNGGEVPAPTTFLPAASSTSSSGGGLLGWFREQQLRSAELRKRLASLGLAAVLAYGEALLLGRWCSVQCVLVCPALPCARPSTAHCIPQAGTALQASLTLSATPLPTCWHGWRTRRVRDLTQPRTSGTL